MAAVGNNKLYCYKVIILGVTLDAIYVLLISRGRVGLQRQYPFERESQQICLLIMKHD